MRILNILLLLLPIFSHSQTTPEASLKNRANHAEEIIRDNTQGKISQSKLKSSFNTIINFEKTLSDSMAFPMTGWEGHTIIWTGTSIPWAFGNNSYPLQVGRALKCKVYNNSISGSTLIFKAPTASDKGSYGMSGSYQQLIQAGFPQNYSYQNRILAYTLPPYNAQTIIIDHGPNDMHLIQDGYLGDIDSYDIGTFYGAYNQIIKQTLEFNPHLRIIITTLINRYQTNGVPHRYFELAVKAQREIAEKWGLPLLDYAHLAGINEVTVLPGRLTTDGLHPTEATSSQIAAISISFLKSIAPYSRIPD